MNQFNLLRRQLFNRRNHPRAQVPSIRAKVRMRTTLAGAPAASIGSLAVVPPRWKMQSTDLDPLDSGR